MKYQYDFSIIIPVYNNELYVDECLKSILKQHYKKNKIQVIAVNDGSTDNSKEVLAKYEKYPNFIIINKENTGVSDTRNIAISKATGKYLMFLDSDDFISSNACKLIYQTFEKYYDKADLLVYPLYRYNNSNKKTNLITRFKSFAETGVYDLEKQYYLFNPTMNVAIKNQFGNNPQFDTNFFFHEDEQFVASIVYVKKKIIYLKEASYYYRIHETSTSSLKSKPYYSYNQYIRLYEEFVKKYTEDGHMVKYIQYSIFNDIKWRVKDQVFFPEYLNDTEYKKEFERIKNIFKYIDDELIYKDKNLSIYYIMYFLNNFKDSKNSFKVEINNGIYDIYYKNNLIFRQNSIELNMYRFKIKNNELDVCLGFKVPFVNLKKHELYEVIEYNNNKKEENKLNTIDVNITKAGKLTDTNIEHYVERKYKNTTNIKNIYYFLKTGNDIIPTQFIFSSNVPFHKTLHRFIIKHNKGVIAVNQNPKLRIYDFKGNNILKDQNLSREIKSEKIQFRKFNIKKDLIPTIKVHLRMLKRNPMSYIYRLCIHQRKNTWIYVDQYSELEEAYYQFIHDSKLKDGIKRYYITSNAEIKGKNIIRRKSLKFRNLSLTANKIITSHYSLGEYSYPIKNKHYFIDKLTNELIFINNKDLKYKSIKGLRKIESNIDKIIVSSNNEKQEYLNNYFYQDDDIIIGGYPSYDVVEKNATKSENKIIFNINWRKDLIKKYNPLIPNYENIENNNMYKMLKDLITSESLNKLLKTNNLILDISFNYLINDCNKLFKQYETNNIKIVEKPNICEYKLLITDTSNIVTKFLRTKNPIIYYLYDEEYIKANFHIFNDLSLEEKFIYGETVKTKDELINEISKIINNKFVPEKKYLKNINNNQVEVSNCQEKIYKAIKDVKQ